jgi:hypothetical protein
MLSDAQYKGWSKAVSMYFSSLPRLAISEDKRRGGT